MSQARLTRTSRCNKTLPYLVNDCKQVRKVHQLLHTSESDRFYWGPDFEPSHHIFNQKMASIFLFIRPHTFPRGVGRPFSLG